MNHNGPVKIAVLGATGSIGDSTLDVLKRHAGHFEVTLLTAHRNGEKLLKLVDEWQPRHVAVSDSDCFLDVKNRLNTGAAKNVCLHAGIPAISALCASGAVDVVVAGMVGSAGVEPVLAAAEAGKTILLANKETLVMAGDIVMRAVRDNQARIIPLDSEHNAIYQCLPDGYHCGQTPPAVEKLILTASGGPFWNEPPENFPGITPKQACRHPKWNMGRKISVDSATLMNKGLELIEAHWLFNLPAEKLDVHVHPQSLVHSLVAYEDGSLLAQLGEPDMRIPIAYGLGQCVPADEQTAPRRLPSGARMLDLLAHGTLTFHPPDDARFPSIRLARNAIEAGGILPAVLNASNEEAVQAFLDGRIGFHQIAQINARILEKTDNTAVESFEHLQQVDVEVRTLAQKEIHHA